MGEYRNSYSKTDHDATFQKYREKSLKNITSKEGIDERINRSIQAEGAFSKIKEGLSYKD